MRRRTRIQPYVSDDTHRKLRAYATAQALTESAVAEAAILEFVDSQPLEEDLVVRRLDALSQSIAQLRHDAEVTSHAIVFIARFLFLTSPPTFAPDARRRADEAYETLLSFVGQRVQVGACLDNEVRRAVAKKAGVQVPAKPKDGQ